MTILFLVIFVSILYDDIVLTFREVVTINQFGKPVLTNDIDSPNQLIKAHL